MEWNGIEETEIREILDEEVMNRESNSWIWKQFSRNQNLLFMNSIRKWKIFRLKTSTSSRLMERGKIMKH
jgi:hypothetical protein